MAELLQVIAQAGPLPIKQTATIETDDPVVVTLSGSVWTSDANSMIGVLLTVDRGEFELGARIFSNVPGEHRAVVPVIGQYTFEIGEHAFALTPMTAETTSDYNDYFCVTVQY